MTSSVRRTRPGWLIAPVAALLLLSACSSGSATGESSSSAPTTPAANTSSDQGTSAAGTPSSPAATTGGSAAANDPAALRAMLPDAIRSSGVLRLGALWETPPGIAADPANPKRPKGFVPDLADQVAEVLGVKVEWQNMQWPAQLPGVQSGNVDALWGQVSINPAREASVVDLVAYYQDKMTLVVAGGNPKNVKSFADLCGMRVAVPTGSEQENAVNGNSKELCEKQGKEAIKVVGFTGAQQAVVAIRADGVDAWMDSGAAIKQIVASDPAGFAEVIVPDDQLDPYIHNKSGIAVAKSNSGLTKALQGALQTIVANGSYTKVLQTWKVEGGALTVDKIEINPYTSTPVGQTAQVTASS